MESISLELVRAKLGDCCGYTGIVVGRSVGDCIEFVSRLVCQRVRIPV